MQHYYLDRIIQSAYKVHAHISVRFVGLVSTREDERWKEVGDEKRRKKRVVKLGPVMQKDLCNKLSSVNRCLAFGVQWAAYCAVRYTEDVIDPIKTGFKLAIGM